MSPPIFNPDGSEVSEIVLPDGSTASEVIGPDGNVVFEAGPDIPDAAVVQLYAGDSGTVTEGTGSVTDWADKIGTFDVSGTVSGGVVNREGYDVIYFDGDDVLSESNLSIPQPLTVIVAAEVTSGQEMFGSSSGETPLLEVNQFGTDTILNAGTTLQGNESPSTPAIYTGIFDGANSALRVNGTEEVSGDAGTDGFNTNNGFALGDTRSQTNFTGYYRQVMIYDGVLSSSVLQSEEQRIADDYGVTLP